MRRSGLLAALLLCLLSSFLWARLGVVRTKDGRSIEGDITDKGPDGASITTRAGTVTLHREDIAAIEYAGNIKEAYQQRLNALPKDAGAKSHYELARWLYDNKENALALTELDTALKLDPNFADAAVLKQTVERSILWEKTRPAGAGAADVRPGPVATRPAANPRDRHLLDADQINIIRQYELHENETSVRVRLDGDVKKRFTDFDNRDPRQFAALTDFDKALAILQKGTAEMRKDVKILSDPISLMQFKRNIQPMLISNCATAGCHGNASTNNFVLYTPADSDAVTYTNFYILTQHSANVGSTQVKSIDRLYPNNSLIAQFGLPRDKSEYDHPEARNWVPMFRNLQDPKYQQMLEWLGKSLVAIEPKFNITYTLPTGTPTAPPPPAAPDPKPPTPPAK